MIHATVVLYFPSTSVLQWYHLRSILVTVAVLVSVYLAHARIIVVRERKSSQTGHDDTREQTGMLVQDALRKCHFHHLGMTQLCRSWRNQVTRAQTWLRVLTLLDIWYLVWPNLSRLTSCVIFRISFYVQISSLSGVCPRFKSLTISDILADSVPSNKKKTFNNCNPDDFCETKAVLYCATCQGFLHWFSNLLRDFRGDHVVTCLSFCTKPSNIGEKDQNGNGINFLICWSPSASLCSRSRVFDIPITRLLWSWAHRININKLDRHRSTPNLALNP